GSSSPTSTSGRAPSGCAVCGSWTTTSRASGRPTATTTTATRGKRSGIGRTDRRPAAGAGPLADRRRRGDPGRDAAREDLPPAPADVDAAPAGPALRRPPHRAGRLPGGGVLLDRLLAARRGRGRADDRPTRRRRGLVLLPRRPRRGRPGRGPRPVRLI